MCRTLWKLALLAGVLGGLASTVTMAAADVDASATAGGLWDEAHQHRFAARPVSCPTGADGLPPVAGVVFEPGREMNPEPDTLQPIARGARGGFVVATGTAMFSRELWRGGTDILVAGLDDGLMPRWGTVFGGPMSDTPVSVIATRDGGAAVISYSRSLWFSTLLRALAKDDGTTLVSRYGANGRLLWVQHLAVGANPGGLSIVAAPDGGIVVGGTAFRDERHAGFVIRFDEQGTVQWARAYGRDREDAIARLEALPDGTLLVSGSQRDAPGSPYDLWVGRLGADGQVLQATAYRSEAGRTTGMAFALANGGALVIRSPEYGPVPPRSRVVVLAVGADGAPRWSRLLAFEDRVTLSNFAEPSPGRYLLFGGARTSELSAGPMVLELDAGGDVVGSRALVSARVAAQPGLEVRGNDQPVSVVQDGGTGYVLLSNLVSMPPEVSTRLQASRGLGELAPELRDQVKLQLLLLRIGDRPPAGPCSRPVAVTATDLPVQRRLFDLPVADLPAGVAAPVPRQNLGLRSLQP